MNHSVHDGNILINPGGKNMLFPNPNNQTWIDTSELGTTGVVRFTEEAPFATVARWQVNDPASDFENDLRPFQENSPDFPGADVPVKP